MTQSPATQSEAIIISERTTLYPGSEGEWPYVIDNGPGPCALTTNEINAIAPHIPVVEGSLKAMVNALDFIENGKATMTFGEEYWRHRSRIIEELHAAIQAVKDVKE